MQFDHVVAKMSKNKAKVFTTIDPEGNVVKKKHSGRVKAKFNIPNQYMNLGMYFLVPILSGLFIGIWLDKRFDREGFFTILLLSIGVIASFYNLIKLYKQDESAY